MGCFLSAASSSVPMPASQINIHIWMEVLSSGPLLPFQQQHPAPSPCLPALELLLNCWSSSEKHTSPQPGAKASVVITQHRKNNANDEHHTRVLPPPEKTTVCHKITTLSHPHIAVNLPLARWSECRKQALFSSMRILQSCPLWSQHLFSRPDCLALASVAHNAERKVSIMVARPLIIEF